jgi:LuxR family glucitol operon transcriptional activator
MAPDPKSSDAASQITLTDVSAEYLARFAPPEKKFFEKVQLALKRLREMVELSAVQQAVYAYDLMAIRTSTRDQRIAATFLKQAADFLRTNDLDSARQKVNEARNLLPGYAESYRIASILETRAGDLYKAADEIETAIQYDPKSAVAHYQYALFLLHEMEDSQQALAQIDLALSLDPKEETLETLRALALMRVGRCKESADIYERLLDNLEVRPRKWRITTRDQASECYRRLAEQNATMHDTELAKEHLNRACHILEEALGANEFDSRMGNLYTNIIEDAIGVGIQVKDSSYAASFLTRLSEVNQAFTCAPFRRLTYDHFVRVFGEDSQASVRAQQLSGRVIWATPRDTAAASFDPPGVQHGKIKAMPVGMPYGFITDEKGSDWFFHKSSVSDINVWRALRNGTGVVFEGLIEPDGKRRATHVEVSKPFV